MALLWWHRWWPLSLSRILCAWIVSYRTSSKRTITTTTTRSNPVQSGVAVTAATVLTGIILIAVRKINGTLSAILTLLP